MVEVIFELFIEDHLVGIANVWIFISRSFSITEWDDAKFWIDDSGGGGMGMRVLFVFIFRCLPSCLF